MIKKILTLAVFVSLVSPVMAKTQPGQFSPLSSNEQFLTEVTQFTRKALGGAKMPNGKIVGRESKKELKQPVIPFEAEQAAIDRGILDATAEWCGIEWENSSYKPFIQEQGAKGWNGKQMAYIEILHGFTMGIIERKTQDKECTEKHESAVVKFLKGQG